MAYTNREARNQNSRDYYQRTLERSRERARRRTATYRAKNREKVYAATRKWAKNNKARVKFLAGRLFPRYYARGDQVILKAKDVPCADCGDRFHFCAMEFDHVRGTKRMNVGAMRTHPVEQILNEIAKCEVVCSNCHRFRTFKRQETKMRIREEHKITVAGVENDRG